MSTASWPCGDWRWPTVGWVIPDNIAHVDITLHAMLPREASRKELEALPMPAQGWHAWRQYQGILSRAPGDF